MIVSLARDVATQGAERRRGQSEARRGWASPLCGHNLKDRSVTKEDPHRQQTQKLWSPTTVKSSQNIRFDRLNFDFDVTTRGGALGEI